MSGEPDNLERRPAFRRGRRALIALIAGLALGLAACASIDPPSAPASIAPTPVPRPVSAEKANPERKRLIEHRMVAGGRDVNGGEVLAHERRHPGGHFTGDQAVLGAK